MQKRAAGFNQSGMVFVLDVLPAFLSEKRSDIVYIVSTCPVQANFLSLDLKSFA